MENIHHSALLSTCIVSRIYKLVTVSACDRNSSLPQIHIMHLVLEQRKQWQKQQISIGNTDLFYNSIGAVRKLYHFKIGKIGLEIIEQGQFKRE